VPTTDLPTADRARVHAVFKAYDVRGTVPDQIDEELVRRIGTAFVQVVGDEVVVGHDMRTSSPGLAAAFAAGAAEAGADVVMIGLASTDELYFASGRLGRAGAMFTASHNPAQYNGIKLCRAGARPIGAETGLHEIRDLVCSGLPPAEGIPAHEVPGHVSELDVLEAYAAHLLSLSPVTGRALKVVVDAGNGMAGLTAPVVFEQLRRRSGDAAELVPLYFELDGTFPHHEANPIEPENLVDLQHRVVAEGADVGLAFDGDADRCFVVDERGSAVSPSTLTALIASRALAEAPGATVIHNLITSRRVPELVAELGGTPERTRVGHSYIKARMAETDAVFGGEHSGHFYFRDFWGADSGMLAALHTLAALSESDRPLSELLAGYAGYALSGEVNSEVADVAAVLAAVEAAYAEMPGVDVDHLDGLTVTTEEWWFNVRASNTEPLLRLNVEGADQETMTRVRDDVLALIRK
jgi:phosphomannomutase